MEDIAEVHLQVDLVEDIAEVDLLVDLVEDIVEVHLLVDLVEDMLLVEIVMEVVTKVDRLLVVALEDSTELVEKVARAVVDIRVLKGEVTVDSAMVGLLLVEGMHLAVKAMEDTKNLALLSLVVMHHTMHIHSVVNNWLVFTKNP